jgi:hypothetical protein
MRPPCRHNLSAWLGWRAQDLSLVTVRTLFDTTDMYRLIVSSYIAWQKISHIK